MLTLEDAVSLAARRSPEARGLERAIAARRSLDDAIPLIVGNPVLRATAGPRVYPVSDLGPEGSIGVFAPVDVIGRRFAERESAARSRAELAARREEAELDVALRAASAWLRLWESARLLVLAQQEHALATDVAASMAEAAQQKALPQGEAARARRYASEAALAVQQAEGALVEQHILLAALLGCEERSWEIPDALPLPLPVDRLLAPALADDHPAVRAREEAAQAETARASALLRQSLGSIDVGVLAEKDGPATYRGLVEVQIPIPVFDRAQAERANAHARAAELRGERDAVRRGARRQLHFAVHEVEHTREVLAVAETSLVPAAEEAVRLEQVAFEQGATTVIELLRARAAHLEAMRTRILAKRAHAEARWRLRLLVDALGGAHVQDEARPANPGGAP